MSTIIARGINKIPSLARFLILVFIIIILLHLFSLDIIRKTKSQSNKNEMKSSFHQEDESKDNTLSKPRETASKVLHADVNSQPGNLPGNLRPYYDLLIVGAGLSGAVIAEQASERKGLTSLVIDKRNHIGGNCYDFVDEKGIRISKYGLHLFHTKFYKVWTYVQKFTKWVPYEHRVKGYVRDINNKLKLVPIPPNQDTINILFGTDIKTEKEMEDWLKTQRPNYDHEPKNGEEMSLSRVGKELYERIFKEYTKKQWNKYPAELDASVLARLPFRLNNDDRYFSDRWQALPEKGYTHMFENMLKSPNIDVALEVDYFKVKEQLPKHKILVFTGPIDAYFSSQGMPSLEYRSIIFEHEYLQPKDGYFQPALMVNYPGNEVNYTRIAEYKHWPIQDDFESVKKSSWTHIVKEYSTDSGDPYYPVPNDKNQELYQSYQKLAEKEKNVVFIGRLASYKYFNMDQAIKNALEMFEEMNNKGQFEL